MRTLDALAGYREDSLAIVAAGADAVRVTGALVTLDYFDILGSAPLLGRVFSRASDAGANEPLAVLGAKAWRQTTAADPGIVGKRLRINGVPHPIVGVMADSFDYPKDAGAWILSNKPVPAPPFDVPVISWQRGS